MTWRSAWLGLALAAFPAGCNSGSDTTPGDSAKGDSATGDSAAGDTTPPGDSFSCPACANAVSCEVGGVCAANGTCHAHEHFASLCMPCSQKLPCPAGMGCVLDSALPGQSYCVAACTTGDDCPNGYNDCVGVPMPGPEWCNAGTPCSGGRTCVSLSGQQFCECQSAADCDVYGGWACSAGECFTAPCNSDLDCGPLGVTCDMGNGVCNLPCTVDDDCTCLNGTCAFSGVPCATAADCTLDCAQVPVGGTPVGLCLTESWICTKDPTTSCSSLGGGPDPCPGG